MNDLIAMPAPLPFRPCALIPTFDNPLTIARVVGEVKRYLSDVIVVDDGSGGAGEEDAAGADDGIFQAGDGGVRSGGSAGQVRGVG